MRFVVWFGFGWLMVSTNAGCEKKKTQTTPLGLIQQGTLIAPAVVSASERSTESEAYATRDECGGEIALRWKTFRAGSASHVASYSVELVKRAEGFEVRVTESRDEFNANSDPQAPYLGAAEIFVFCRNDAEFLNSERTPRCYWLLADGTVLRGVGGVHPITAPGDARD